MGVSGGLEQSPGVLENIENGRKEREGQEGGRERWESCVNLSGVPETWIPVRLLPFPI